MLLKDGSVRDDDGVDSRGGHAVGRHGRCHRRYTAVTAAINAVAVVVATVTGAVAGAAAAVAVVGGGKGLWCMGRTSVSGAAVVLLWRQAQHRNMHTS